MNADRAVCFVCAAVAGALFVLPSRPEPAPILHPDAYVTAESMGCIEVLRVCKARKRMTAVAWKGRR